jgi:hypothetical protein
MSSWLSATMKEIQDSILLRYEPRDVYFMPRSETHHLLKASRRFAASAWLNVEASRGPAMSGCALLHPRYLSNVAWSLAIVMSCTFFPWREPQRMADLHSLYDCIC